MTRYELHVQEWSDCQRCDYSKRRKRVVLGKGELPCDILIVAEGPGDSEDVCGVPMVAQAGRLMDKILIKSGIVKPNNEGFIWGEGETPPATWTYTVSITNLVGCIPLAANRDKEEPDYDAVVACRPRLEEWIEFADPRLVITAGKPAKEWFDQTWKECIKTKAPVVNIMHPSGILRQPYVARGEILKQEIVRIRSAIKTYITGESNNASTPTETKPKATFRKRDAEGNVDGETAQELVKRLNAQSTDTRKTRS